jgi:hypothetical protein
MRYIPYKKGYQVKEEFKSFFKNYKLTFSILCFFFTTIMVSTLNSLSVFQYLILSLAAILCLFYERFIKSFHLRTTPFLKAILIALIWSTLCVLIHFESVESSQRLLVVFIECFLFIFILCQALDYKDSGEDREQKIKTIANTLAPGFFLTLLVIGFTSFQLFETEFESFSSIMLSVISMIIFLFALSLESFKRISNAYYILLIDGLIFIHSARLLNFG